MTIPASPRSTYTVTIDEDEDLVSIWCFNAVDEKSFSHYFIDFMDMLDRILDQEVFQDEIFNKITPIED